MAGTHVFDSEGISPAPTFFAEVVDYVGFTPADGQRLAAFLPRAEPHFVGIAEHFYERILAHDQAHAAITGGPEQIERLKASDADRLLKGPRDRRKSVAANDRRDMTRPDKAIDAHLIFFRRQQPL